VELRHPDRFGKRGRGRRGGRPLPGRLSCRAVRVLALDFDGVISDSAREAFGVALRTFADLDPAAKLASLASDPLPEAHPDLYDLFLASMPLGNRAEDFGVVLSAAAAGAPLESQDAYDSYRNGLDSSWLEAFHSHFYEVRTLWSERDREQWLALMAPYPAILELLRRRSSDVELAIATAKDGASVAALLERYGVADLFPSERILDKETGVDKRAHLQLLSERLACPLSELTFVDDKVNHLESVAPLGVRCGLATWGYNGLREQERAREFGYRVLTLENVEEQLFAAD